MKTSTCLVLLLTQISTIFGLPFLSQSKCWLWDSPCLTARAQALVPSITAGFPELGTERLDVMAIDALHVNKDGFKTDWNNVYYQGLRNAVIDKLSIDMNSKVMTLVFHTDIIVRGNYVAEGSLVSYPFFGNGRFTVTFDNLQTEMIIPFEIIKDLYGRDIINLKGYQYWFDVKDGATFNFENLFYGDNARSAKTQASLNQQWKYLCSRFGRTLFDPVNDKIFNAIRTFTLSQPIASVAFY